MISLKDHLDYPDEVAQIIRAKKFNELLYYTNFCSCKLRSYGLMIPLIESNNKKIIKHVVKNLISINPSNSQRECLIHYLVRLNDVNLFDQFVNKYHIDLELRVGQGWCPIHYASVHGSKKMIEYFVNKGVELESQSNFGWRAIHYVCENRGYDIIKFFLERNINLIGRVTFFGYDGNYNINDLVKMNMKLTIEQQKELLDIIDKKSDGLIDWNNQLNHLCELICIARYLI